ncbi:unnamed protein product [Arabidopsis arenosa]|uniref:Patatin n=1 Tax=Arabidopsis arenosa TaxID=38785 RepID=A0A8S2ASX9_ARAAE|nr:unnamed protein product [Arabidopsis arenosa]
MKKGGFSNNLKLAIPVAGEQSITKFLTQSGTFKDGDLRVNKDGVRIISQSEPEVLSPIKPADDQLSLSDLDMVKVIGKGSSGVVQLVQHKWTGQFFALKVIQLNIDEAIRKAIAQELKINQSSQCPNLVTSYQSFYDNGAISLILEYMDGGSLADFLKSVKAIPDSYLSAIFRQVLQGLIYLHHDRHIIHRDLKPSNLLINHRGEVKITDFGVSTVMTNTAGLANTFVGTYNYMSPERIVGNKYGNKSDIWSLGLVVLECATGKFPYAPPNQEETWTSVFELMEAIVDQPPPALPSGNFSPELSSFISTCLQKDPNSRSSAKELMEHPFLNKYDYSGINLASYFTDAGSPLATLGNLSSLSKSFTIMNRRYEKPPPLSVSSKGKKKHFVNHTAPNTPGNYERTQTSPTLSTTRSHEPDDKLNYEIFSILESKFLFGYEDPRLLWIPRSPLRPGDSEAGLLAGKSLIYLEQMLKEKSGDPNARIADYFDVAAGSGVGGVFAAMIFATRDGNRPIFKAEDTWKFLVENAEGFYRSGGGSGGGGAGAAIKRVIRSGSGSGSSSVTAATAKLEKAMKASFADLTLKDTLKPILISCYDLSSTAPFLFSRADALESDSFDFRLRDICRATWAEPGTFDPVRTCSVDGKTRCVAVGGGLAMSNPTAAAITHVFHNKQEFPAVKGVEDLLVLSLGTGQLFEVNYDYEQVKNWRVKEWARPMARISGDGSAEFVDQAVAMGFGPYRKYRQRIAIRSLWTERDTDPRAENVKKLTEIADEMLKQNNVESVLFGSKRIGEMSNSEKLEWFASELVIEQQRRSVRASPTVTLKQAVSKTNRKRYKRYSHSHI